MYVPVRPTPALEPTHVLLKENGKDLDITWREILFNENCFWLKEDHDGDGSWNPYLFNLNPLVPKAN